LLALLERLRALGYHFTTPTPATHARVVARPHRQEGASLTDVLGWSLPFKPELLDPETLRLLEAGEAVEPAERGLVRSRYRVSSLHDGLYLHSAYPTDAQDAVFFGPDSYRFAELIARELEAAPAATGASIVDIGTGSGVGGLVAASAAPGARITMTDVNPQALRLARINAEAAGVEVTAIEGADLNGVEGQIDLALANPPYIIDDGDRAYRDGGEMLGGQISLDMARMAVERLAPGGRMILYTGSAIVDGEDQLREALEALAADQGLALRYRELDPDVFGEELERPAYASVDRIAVVAAIFTRGER
jgi:methylase of polypeptide subunit release factors